MIRKTLLTAAALTASWSLAAQQQSVSPYSLFGAGWAQAQANAYQQFLGGASAADRNPWYLNPDQPASLSAIKYTTLDFGGQLSGVNQSDGTNRTLNRTGNFNSFGIAVPLTKGMGISGSLRPYTAVGYDFQQSGTDSSFGDWIQRYVGRGGLNATALTWSWAPIKYVSFGATARYLFGSADRSTKVYFTDGRFDFAGKVERVLVSDWRWNAGAQLILPIGLNELVAGVQYEPKADLSATQNYTWYSFKTNSDGAELPLDTVTSVYAAQGSIALGGRQAVGIRWATNTQEHAFARVDAQWPFRTHASRRSPRLQCRFSRQLPRLCPSLDRPNELRADADFDEEEAFVVPESSSVRGLLSPGSIRTFLRRSRGSRVERQPRNGHAGGRPQLYSGRRKSGHRASWPQFWTYWFS